MNFNQKVWNALKKIPHGKVATYAQIARAIGVPRSFRAVGTACGKNENAPLIPCHRVVASSGELGGYSGGLAKKVNLLAKEGVSVKNNKIVNFSGILTKQAELK